MNPQANLETRNRLASYFRDWLNPPVQFDFLLRPFRQSAGPITVIVAGKPVSVDLVRNPRARRYVLRLQPNGSARVTIPRGGSVHAAVQFAEQHRNWLEQQLHRLASRPVRPTVWTIGTEIYFRGVLTKLEMQIAGDEKILQLGPETIASASHESALRPAVERHLLNLAKQELPPRVLELAAIHCLTVRRVSVRNQRTRWGSCSRRGTISLNWRLVQTPIFVRDYIILHELCHLREMNHSRRFWAEVERVCPDFQLAERWLRSHASLLR